MGSVFGGADDQAKRGPSGAHSGPSYVGKSDEKPSSIADGPGKIGRDPTASETREATDGPKEVDQISAETGIWEQRAFRMLTTLESSKGFKGLPSKLRGEIRALIEDAPDEAFS